MRLFIFAADASGRIFVGAGSVRRRRVAAGRRGVVCRGVVRRGVRVRRGGRVGRPRLRLGLVAYEVQEGVPESVLGDPLRAHDEESRSGRVVVRVDGGRRRRRLRVPRGGGARAFPRGRFLFLFLLRRAPSRGGGSRSRGYERVRGLAARGRRAGLDGGSRSVSGSVFVGDGVGVGGEHDAEDALASSEELSARRDAARIARALALERDALDRGLRVRGGGEGDVRHALVRDDAHVPEFAEGAEQGRELGRGNPEAAHDEQARVRRAGGGGSGHPSSGAARRERGVSGGSRRALTAGTRASRHREGRRRGDAPLLPAGGGEGHNDNARRTRSSSRWSRAAGELTAPRVAGRPYFLPYEYLSKQQAAVSRDNRHTT